MKLIELSYACQLYVYVKLREEISLPGLVYITSWCWKWKGWLFSAGGAKAQKSCSWKSHCWQTNLLPAPYSLQPAQVKRSGRFTSDRGCWGWLKWSISSPKISWGEVGNSITGDLLGTNSVGWVTVGSSIDSDLLRRKVLVFFKCLLVLMVSLFSLPTLPDLISCLVV